MIKNAVGRYIPESIKGYGNLTPFEGSDATYPQIKPKATGIIKRKSKEQNKILPTLVDAIKATGLKDGMTISFHHHFRNGDMVVNQVMDAIASCGIKNLTLAPSSLTEPHDYIAPYVENRVVTKIITSGLRKKLGDLASNGKIEYPVLFHSHGGRARRIEEGSTQIDVAFIAAPGCDFLGNINGTDSLTPCGSLGYAHVDARNAKYVVAVTNDIKGTPLKRISIPHYLVDYIVKIDNIGDPKKIGTGATRLTTNPMDLVLAKISADIIAASPYFKSNFSFQTGSGGAALATTRFLKEHMIKRGIIAGFATGGITSYMVDLLNDKLVDCLYDVQSFDLNSSLSLRDNSNHIEMDSSFYANPLNAGPIVNYLDVVILSALEVDTKFNVNVVTGSNGIIREASGGHCDTAYGAKLSIVIAPSFRSRLPIIVDDVTTVVTPGEDVDIVVTERGIAVNPARKDIESWIKNAGYPVYDINDLKKRIENLTGKPEPIKFSDEIVALIEYRDGTIIDTIRKVEQ
jgi:citrate lyase subunit alpha/citrate CoA-transferase